MESKKRKSPTESATIYKVGTELKGNDGNMWKIVKTKSGVQRWIPVKLNEKKLDSKISWRITTPVSEMEMYDDNDKKIKIPKWYMESKLNIKDGDEVALLWYDSKLTYSYPVRGSTRLAIYKAIEKGMNSVIKYNKDPDLQSRIYEKIGSFSKESTKKKLMNKFENGELTPRDLVGQYDFYEGRLRRKNGIWIYGIGS